MASPVGKRFILTERQTLLESGIATLTTVSGTVQIERAVTTYQRNSMGDADASYLDSETLHTSAYILRRLKSIITSKYARHKLADDGTRYGAGQAIVTPSVIKGELVAEYARLELKGICENRDLFKAHLIVERDVDNPNRLNVLFPPDYVNQLRIFALLNQFRLQYSEE
jgi:phage tail sheath protein